MSQSPLWDKTLSPRWQGLRTISLTLVFTDSSYFQNYLSQHPPIFQWGCFMDLCGYIVQLYCLVTFCIQFWDSLNLLNISIYIYSSSFCAISSTDFGKKKKSIVLYNLNHIIIQNGFFVLKMSLCFSYLTLLPFLSPQIW